MHPNNKTNLHGRNNLIKHLQSIASIVLLGLAQPGMASNSSNSWLSSGGDLENTHSAHQTSISTRNVDSLTLNWKFYTQPDTAPNAPTSGAVSITPAVEGKFIYFTDFTGNLYKNNRKTGENIWTKNLLQNYSQPGKTISQSRNTPLILGDLLIIGSNFLINDQLCAVVAARRGIPAPAPAPGVCQSGDGAIVIAVDKNTGNLVWSKKVDDHFMAKVTGSLSGIGNKVFVGVASWEEDAARDYPDVSKLADGTFSINLTGPYKCCTFRGSVVALDAKNGGNILWKTYLSPGLDATNQLSSALHQLLTTRADGSVDRGFFGVSAYGHSPTIDKKRGLIYVATSQNETAPEVAELCEKYRRNKLGLRPDIYGPVGSVANPDLSQSFKKAKLTCANLNEKFNNYQGAMIAFDMNNGKVKWAFQPKAYDAWTHTCTPPGLQGSSLTANFFPNPIINSTNCFQDPIGPNYGFGNNPLLIDNGKSDLVVAGNKDGRVFALKPENGKLIWMQNVDPGSIYGGIQFGMASDGKSIYFGTANKMNNGRNRNDTFESVEDFLTRNGLGNSVLAYPLHYGLNDKLESPTNLLEYPAPSSLILPFPSPSLIFGPSGGYPSTPPMNGPGSGPYEVWNVINMPSDVIPDDVNVWLNPQNGKPQTIAGMVHSLDAATGRINWQRPAIDSITGRILPSDVFGSVTVANGVVFAGYNDSQGTLVGLSAKSGKRLFLYHNTRTYADPSGAMKTVNIGGNEAGPSVIDGCIYWGIGAHTQGRAPLPSSALPELGYPNSSLVQVFPFGGNSLISFCLPGCSREGE